LLIFTAKYGVGLGIEILGHESLLIIDIEYISSLLLTYNKGLSALSKY